MSNLPKSYFQDIPADVMDEIAEEMDEIDESEFSIADCEGRNHKEHWGMLWQCAECLRVLCCAEGAADDYFHLCDDCWARVHEQTVAAFA